MNPQMTPITPIRYRTVLESWAHLPQSNEPTGNCKPCADRGRVTLATRMMGDEPWCENCFRGGDGTKVVRTEEMQETAACAMRAAVRTRERRRHVEDFCAPPLPPLPSPPAIPVVRPFRYRTILEGWQQLPKAEEVRHDNR
jgi:hypothetical protein